MNEWSSPVTARSPGQQFRAHLIWEKLSFSLAMPWVSGLLPLCAWLAQWPQCCEPGLAHRYRMHPPSSLYLVSLRQVGVGRFRKLVCPGYFLLGKVSQIFGLFSNHCCYAMLMVVSVFLLPLARKHPALHHELWSSTVWLLSLSDQQTLLLHPCSENTVIRNCSRTCQVVLLACFAMTILLSFLSFLVSEE